MATLPLISEETAPCPVRVTTTPDGITAIGINRPANRNSINPPTAKRLREAFLEFEKDSSQKVCVFYGVGANFSSGFDLSELSKWEIPPPGAPGSTNITRSKFEPVRGRNLGPLGPSRMQIRKPVICSVSGYAVAGGLELSLLADIRIVEEDVVFGIFSRRFGVPLLDGGTVRLQAVVGLGRALDIIMTGRPVDAKEALNIGLATRVVSKGRAFEEAMKLAQMMVTFPQECLNADRESCYYAAYQARSLEDALSFEYEEATKVADIGIREGLKFTRGKGRHGNSKL